MIHRSTRHLPFLLLALVTLPAAAAQSELPPPVAESWQGLETAGLDTDDYRASYEAGRLHFEPADGTPGITLALAAIERGGETLFQATGASRPRLDGDALEIDWPGFEERYDPRHGGLEQSFVFPAPLPGAGDLCVRLDLDTKLVPTHQRADVLTFAHGERSTLSIQKVLGIDAAGREQAGELRLVGNSIELVLPAAFVDSAAYPLILDPLLVPLSVFFTGDGYNDPDVAWEGRSGYSVVTWTEIDASLDSNLVWVAVLSETGSLIGASMVHQSIPAGPALQPAICSVTEAGACVIAYPWNTGDEAELIFLAYDPTDLHGIGPANWIETPWLTGFDIGGEPMEGIETACVVWTQDPSVSGAVFGQFIEVSGSLEVHIGADFVIDDGSTADAAHPRVSQSNGPAGRWLAVWEQALPGGGTLPTFRTIDFEGNLGDFGITSDEGDRPSCDGDGEHFLIAYHRRNRLGMHEIVAELFDLKDGVTLLRKEVVTQEEIEVAEPQVAIVLNESTYHNAYAVAWEERTGPGILETSRYRVVTEPTLAPLGSATHVGSYSFMNQRIASRFAADFSLTTPDLFTVALRSPLGIMRALGN